MDTRSLDAILDEINAANAAPPTPQSAGMQDAAAHEVTVTATTPAPGTSAYLGNPGGYAPTANSAQRTLLGGQTTLNLQDDTPGVLEDELTQRQRHLPKLDLRVMGGALAVFILIVGIGSATILTGQEQDVRNFASDGGYAQVTQTGAPMATAEPATDPITKTLASQLAPYSERLQDPGTMVLITVLVFSAGFVGLGGFLFWLLRQDAPREV